MEHHEHDVPPRTRSASKSSARRDVIAALVALIAYVRVLALYIARRPAVIAGGLAALVPLCCTRRDYTKPRRPKTRDWWDDVVPDMRQNDRRRYIRSFRVPPCVVDEIVRKAEDHPHFRSSDINQGRAVSVSKKIHMGLWRLGRPATVNDCGELFGLSDGFVDKWTPIVLHFIFDNFGDRLWKREWEGKSQKHVCWHTTFARLLCRSSRQG